MLDLSVTVSQASPSTGKQIISTLSQQGFEVYNAKRRAFGLLGMKFLATVRHNGDVDAALDAVKAALPSAQIEAQPFAV